MESEIRRESISFRRAWQVGPGWILTSDDATSTSEVPGPALGDEVKDAECKGTAGRGADSEIAWSPPAEQRIGELAVLL